MRSPKFRFHLLFRLKTRSLRQMFTVWKLEPLLPPTAPVRQRIRKQKRVTSASMSVLPKKNSNSRRLRRPFSKSTHSCRKALPNLAPPWLLSSGLSPRERNLGSNCPLGRDLSVALRRFACPGCDSASLPYGGKEDPEERSLQRISSGSRATDWAALGVAGGLKNHPAEGSNPSRSTCVQNAGYLKLLGNPALELVEAKAVTGDAFERGLTRESGEAGLCRRLRRLDRLAHAA